MAIEQAMEAQRLLQKELEKNEKIVSTGNEVEEIFHDDALVINESVNDLNEESRAQLNSFSNLELQIKENRLLIDQLLHDLKSGRISGSYFQFVRCSPDFSGSCFGHFRRELSKYHQELLSLTVDPIDHSLIEFNHNNGSDYSFKVGTRNSIMFQSPETNHDIFFSNLVVDLYDPNHNKVQITLKERVKNAKRIVKIEFEPVVSDLHKLTITYHGNHINGSPFYFMVSSNLSDSIMSTTNMKNTQSIDSFIISGSFL